MALLSNVAFVHCKQVLMCCMDSVSASMWPAGADLGSGPTWALARLSEKILHKILCKIIQDFYMQENEKILQDLLRCK